MAEQIMPLRPPLKWAGGKRWLVPKLQKIWAKHPNLRLVEPFCGGLSVALGLQPKTALLNDVNSALVNFYQQIQQGLQLDIALENEESAYYQQRKLFNTLNQKNVEHHTIAQLFYYLNRTGYNGLCRFNQSGGYNVPFGRYKKINYQKDFLNYQTLLSDWEFVSNDFTKLKLRTDDFIYADPPYDVPFRQYSQQGFNWDDQERLVHWLVKHSGPVILSNQATAKIRELYQDFGFKLKILDAPRRISCKVSSRKAVKEVIATRGI
ncbi:MAG: adenine methyltransferase [Methylophaga sp.]|nr:MAG: adenine methyltransferase [Methylophaga sp.]